MGLDPIFGNGDSAFFWWEPWHPAGPFIKKYNRRILYDSNIQTHVKVAFEIKFMLLFNLFIFSLLGD